MATKTFTLNTTPHVAQIGDLLRLEFQPEVMGDEWAEAFLELRTRQKAVAVDDEDELLDLLEEDPKLLRAGAEALRDFLVRWMLPESAAEFADAKLPDRVLLELFRWLQEVYGGERPTGSSSESSSPSPTAGTSSTATSRSRASTSTRSRSAASATRRKR